MSRLSLLPLLLLLSWVLIASGLDLASVHSSIHHSSAPHTKKQIAEGDHLKCVTFGSTPSPAKSTASRGPRWDMYALKRATRRILGLFDLFGFHSSALDAIDFAERMYFSGEDLDSSSRSLKLSNQEIITASDLLYIPTLDIDTIVVFYSDLKRSNNYGLLSVRIVLPLEVEEKDALCLRRQLHEALKANPRLSGYKGWFVRHPYQLHKLPARFRRARNQGNDLGTMDSRFTTVIDVDTSPLDYDTHLVVVDILRTLLQEISSYVTYATAAEPAMMQEGRFWTSVQFPSEQMPPPRVEKTNSKPGNDDSADVSGGVSSALSRRHDEEVEHIVVPYVPDGLSAVVYYPKEKKKDGRPADQEDMIIKVAFVMVPHDIFTRNLAVQYVDARAQEIVRKLGLTKPSFEIYAPHRLWFGARQEKRLVWGFTIDARMSGWERPTLAQAAKEIVWYLGLLTDDRRALVDFPVPDIMKQGHVEGEGIDPSTSSSLSPVAKELQAPPPPGLPYIPTVKYLKAVRVFYAEKQYKRYGFRILLPLQATTADVNYHVWALSYEVLSAFQETAFSFQCRSVVAAHDMTPDGPKALNRLTLAIDITVLGNEEHIDMLRDIQEYFDGKWIGETQVVAHYLPVDDVFWTSVWFDDPWIPATANSGSVVSGK